MAEWRAVPGWPYEVSDDGIVRRSTHDRPSGGVRPGRVLADWADRHGYRRVHLSTPGKHACVFVHRLVALTFIGPAPSDEHHVAHFDGNPANNRADNLRWALPCENERDKSRHTAHPRIIGRGESNWAAKLTQDVIEHIAQQCASGASQREVARRFGVHQSTISRIVSGRAWVWLP
jgi:hypothetical protein